METSVVKDTGDIRRLCESHGLSSFLQLLTDASGWSDCARSGRMPFQGVSPPPAPPDLEGLVDAGRAIAALAELRHTEGGVCCSSSSSSSSSSGRSSNGGCQLSASRPISSGLLRRCLASFDADAFPTLHEALTATLHEAGETTAAETATAAFEAGDEGAQAGRNIGAVVDYRGWRRAQFASVVGDCGVTSMLSRALPPAVLRYVAAAADVATTASRSPSPKLSAGASSFGAEAGPNGSGGAGTMLPAAWEAALRSSLQVEFLAWHVLPHVGGGWTGAGGGAGSVAGTNGGEPHHHHSVLGVSYHLRQGRALAALEAVLLARVEEQQLRNRVLTVANPAAAARAGLEAGSGTEAETEAGTGEEGSSGGHADIEDIEDDETTPAPAVAVAAAAAARRVFGGLHQQLLRDQHLRSQPPKQLTADEWSVVLRAPLSPAAAAGLLAVAAPVVGFRAWIQD
jgi:hypothetical protein